MSFGKVRKENGGMAVTGAKSPGDAWECKGTQIIDERRL